MVKIGDLCIIRDARQASVNGKAIPMSSRAFDILQVLIDAQGALVSMNTLINKVWPTTVVEENNVQVHICTLRRALGSNRHLIKTVHGRGYQLAASTPMPPNSPRQPLADTLLEPMVNTHFFGETIGREKEIEQILKMLRSSPQLITLAGPPGVGKSRLAYDVMTVVRDDFSFTYYADLSVQPISQKLMDDISTTCQTAFVERKASLSFSNTPCKALVVIDNCDQVSAESLKILTTFVIQNSDFVFMATCRKPLHSALESRLRVLPLTISNTASKLKYPSTASTAVDMFVSRVSAQDSMAVIDDAFLCKALALVSELDGLPLAIEIASDHTVTLGIDATAKLIAEGVDLTARNCQTGRPQDKSLQASIELSWQSLTHDHQKLVIQMAVTHKDLDLQGVIDAGAEADLSLKMTLDSLSILIDYALVERQQVQGSTVYRLLKIIRRFVQFGPHGMEAPKRPAITKAHRVVAVLESPCHMVHRSQSSPILSLNALSRSGLTKPTKDPSGIDIAAACRLALICDS